MSFFIPDRGISGPAISISEVCLDSDIEKAFALAEDIYMTEVTNFMNNQPGFRAKTSEERRMVYILARALQAYAKAYEAPK